MFWNELHKVHMVKVNKVTLSRNNDKQVIQADGVSMLMHGHKDTIPTQNGIAETNQS